MNDITLDQVEGNAQFDFKNLFDDSKDDILTDNMDSIYYDNDYDCKYSSPDEFNKLIPNLYSKSKFSVTALNCCSMSAHWDEIQELMAQLSSSEFSFDVLGLTEIFRSKDDSSPKLTGYHALKSNLRPIDDDIRGGVSVCSLRIIFNVKIVMICQFLFPISSKHYLLKL